MKIDYHPAIAGELEEIRLIRGANIFTKPLLLPFLTGGLKIRAPI